MKPKFQIQKSASDASHYLIWVGIIDPNNQDRTSFQTVALYKQNGMQLDPWNDSVSFFPAVPTCFSVSKLEIEVYIRLCYQLHLDRMEEEQQ